MAAQTPQILDLTGPALGLQHSLEASALGLRPGGEIGDEHVVTEVQLRLGEHEPPTGVAVEMEGAAKLCGESDSSLSVARGRPRRGVQLAVEHLRNVVLGNED